jgi:hypothetical protein
VIGRAAGTVSSSGPSIRFRTFPVGQLRQEPIHRLVQPQLAFLHQDHRRCGRDRLGHRGNAEDRVPPHRAAPERLLADRIDVDLAAPADERDETGELAARNIAGHDIVHAAKPRPGQSSGAHRLLPPTGLIRSRWPPWRGLSRRRAHGGGRAERRRSRRSSQEGPAVEPRPSLLRYRNIFSWFRLRSRDPARSGRSLPTFGRHPARPHPGSRVKSGREHRAHSSSRRTGWCRIDLSTGSFCGSPATVCRTVPLCTSEEPHERSALLRDAVESVRERAMTDASSTNQPRIARIWRGRTTRERADEYAGYLYEHGIKPLEEKALGVQLLREDRETESEFVRDGSICRPPPRNLR